MPTASYEPTLRQWAQIFEHAQWGAFLGSADGSRLELVNPAFARMHGSTVEELAGQILIEVFASQAQAVLPEQFQQVRESGQHGFDSHLLRRDETVVPVHMDVTAVRDDTSEVLFFAATVHDTKELAESDLARSRLAAIVESSDDAILAKTLDGTIVSWNAGAAQLYGYTADETIGRPIGILVPPEHQDEIPVLLERIGRGERIAHYETARVTKDGRLLDISLTISPVLDNTGAIVGASAIARDITEAKRAQRALARQARLLELAHDAVIVRDLAGTITFWNHGAEAMYGWTRDKALGHDSHELLQTRFPQPLVELEAQLLRTGRWEGEVVQSTRHSAVITTASRWSLERDDQGEPVAVLEINSDVTERRRAEAALEAANRELESFSYSVAHDLRAPLRSISGFSRILIEDFAPQLPSDAQHYLQLVQDSAHQMGQLVDDLLTFSRLSRQPLVKREVQPADLVQREWAALERENDGSRVAVVLGELPPCEADPALLKQVYANLLANAVKFTGQREQPVVEIGACEGEEPGKTIYYVRDNGVGFDMAYAHKLFGVFQRLHRAEDYEGTGIGLALVQRIVHRHGGRIWAEAEVDRGATFFFTLSDVGLPDHVPSIGGDTKLEDQ